MAVRKGLARLVAADGTVIGEGRAYIHLRLPDDQPQAAQGTLSLDWWDDAAPAPHQILLDGGPAIPVEVQGDHLSGCVVGRILRYQTDWPGSSAGTGAGQP